MKWLVNVDSRSEEEGGHSFARWLAQTTTAQGHESIVEAVHDIRIDEHGEFCVLARAIDSFAEATGEVGSSNATHETLAVEEVFQALENEASKQEATGLIIPREAARDGFHLVRLGPLARRIHSASQVPFVIVPPDLKTQEIGDGPIIAATDLGFESLAACEMAAKIAAATGRTLTVVYVAQVGEFLLGGGHEQWGQPRVLPEDNQTHPYQRLKKWVQDNQIPADALDLLVGHSGEALVEYAGLEFSPLVVAGRRRTAPLEKILRRSTSAYLCGHSACATLVVPSVPARSADWSVAA
jgi:nucleotide-binding universal stress UspA family protein